MPYQELHGLGMKGLNTDTPAQALDHTHFSDGNNMRPFDGALQTVFDFSSTNLNITPIDQQDLYAFTHWIQTGSSEFRAAYLYNDGSGLELQIVDDITGTDPVISGHTTSMADINVNSFWKTQLFPFNGLLVVNDSENQPQFVTYDGVNAPQSGFILGWPGGSDTDTTTQAAEASRVTCERLIPYNGRLVALNMTGDYIQSASNTIALGNASLVWSSPITELDSLNGVTFKFSDTNSAGDDILTETPGQILDGGTLGEYLIVYKSDAVYRYTDVGEPLYLVGETLFVDDGLYSPDAWADIGGGRHIVMGNFGVYVHDGGPSKQNVSRGRIQRELYARASDGQKSSVFAFHHENDKEVWFCISVNQNTDATIAYVYNYELDAWYKRDLPSSQGIKGIEAIQQGGELYIYAYGQTGVRQLGSERANVMYANGAYIELHYLGFGDHSRVKHLSAVYPHVQDHVVVNVTATDNLGIDVTNIFDDEEDREFNAAEEYKLDYRIHGRYYHVYVSRDGTANPNITGMGFDMKLGGQR